MDNVNPITREEKILSGEDLQPRTRMEYFLKKASENGGGSGSGLPSYDVEDENKILTVKHVVEETIWVPKQTIEVSNEYAYDINVNFDRSDLRVGLEATAVFTVFGMDMSVQCYVVDDPTYGLMWEDENQTAQLYLDPESNKWTIHANNFPDGTYTGKFVTEEDKGVIPVWDNSGLVYHFVKNVTTPQELYAALDRGQLVVENSEGNSGEFVQHYLLYLTGSRDGTDTYYRAMFGGVWSNSSNNTYKKISYTSESFTEPMGNNGSAT